MNKKLVIKYSILDMVVNRRNMILAMVLIVVSTYITMLFIGIDGLFVDYSNSAIWSIPQNMTIIISNDEEKEVYLTQEFIDRINNDSRVDSLQVQYKFSNMQLTKFEDTQYLVNYSEFAHNGHYSLFNTAYKNYILTLDNSVKDIIVGTLFEDSGECQVLLSNCICWQLDEKYISQPEKMQDFIGKYIYVNNTQGKEIPVKIVGIYNSLLTASIRNSIDLGYLIDTKRMDGRSEFFNVDNNEEMLDSGIMWNDIILNETAFMAIENVDSEFENVKSLEIVLKNYKDIKKFCKTIENEGYFVNSKILDLEYQILFIKKIRLILLALMVFVSFVAVIIIIDSINIILNKKRKNMAMLNAVGIEKKLISRMFRFEFTCFGTLAFFISYLLSSYSMKSLVKFLNYRFQEEKYFSAVSLNFGGIKFAFLYVLIIIIINLVILIPLHSELDKNILERIKG